MNNCYQKLSCRQLIISALNYFLLSFSCFYEFLQSQNFLFCGGSFFPFFWYSDFQFSKLKFPTCRSDNGSQAQLSSQKHKLVVLRALIKALNLTLNVVQLLVETMDINAEYFFIF